ncbi:hypothetical protein HNQ80_003992 [Anaerosolibacter carboniphilus]|uniref:Uncharacterized protein n=1 Tax=Anaerosolibacter carboniphilus TaxID=1417629 RepID=A0A841KVZ4_9FIRM|nr:hypothetical protein [Anaerosolibacter carboniphilus]
MFYKAYVKIRENIYLEYGTINMDVENTVQNYFILSNVCENFSVQKQRIKWNCFMDLQNLFI